MPTEMPKLFLARHGDTAWTDSHQRTGRTDIPLNAAGEERARQLGERLGKILVRNTSSLAPCSAPRKPANWPASGRSRRSIRIWSNGTTDASKGCSRRRL